MTTLDELINELETYNRLDALEAGIAALSARIAGHATSPEQVARVLTLSPSLLCHQTLEPKVAYLPTACVWLSRENGRWRTRSNKEIARVFRTVLEQEQGRAISNAKASQIERAARQLFARAEVPGGSA